MYTPLVTSFIYYPSLGLSFKWGEYLPITKVQLKDLFVQGELLELLEF